MKFTTALFGLFLLSTLISHLPSTTAVFINDTDGIPLINGGTYYMIPVYTAQGVGGGIELTTTGNETCPLSVVQSPFQDSKGLPIRISSPIPVGNINEGMDLELSFTSVPSCAPTPSKWTIVKSQGLSTVKLTGYEDTVHGWFYIQINNVVDYKLFFCSYSISGSCQDITLHIDSDGNRSLVLTTNQYPHIVQFKNVYHRFAA